jgi:hypothetical protein
VPGAEVQFYVAFFTAIYKIAECDILAVVTMNIAVFWKTGPSLALKIVTVLRSKLMPPSLVSQQSSYTAADSFKNSVTIFFQSMRSHIA